jgi:hypothetical protein
MTGVSADSGAVRSTTSTVPALKASAKLSRIGMRAPSRRSGDDREHRLPDPGPEDAEAFTRSGVFSGRRPTFRLSGSCAW